MSDLPILLIVGSRTYQLSGAKIEIRPGLRETEQSSVFVGTEEVGELRELESHGRRITIEAEIDEERVTPKNWKGW